MKNTSTKIHQGSKTPSSGANIHKSQMHHNQHRPITPAEPSPSGRTTYPLDRPPRSQGPSARSSRPWAMRSASAPRVVVLAGLIVVGHGGSVGRATYRYPVCEAREGR
ncbi:hypothetical protein KM043_013618 [Ampulex compressa]|nr:hypothetical protein KM043_013618 [Ampulex compressa]